MTVRKPKYINEYDSFDHRKFLRRFSDSDLTIEDLKRAAQPAPLSVPTIDEQGALHYRKSVYLDNAATASILQPVSAYARALEDNFRSNVGRSYGYKETVMRIACNQVRGEAAKWFSAKKDDLAILGSNVTQLFLILIKHIVAQNPETRFLLSPMSHSALSVPIHNLRDDLWSHLAIGENFEYDVDYLRTRLESNQRAGLKTTIAIETISNLTGYETNWQDVLRLAEEFNARVIIDNAQGACFVDIQSRDYACPIHIGISGHKMGARDGSAVLLGSTDTFQREVPLDATGGMIFNYTRDREYYLGAPWSLEAGTPNFVAQASLASALRILHSVGKSAIRDAYRENTEYLENAVQKVPGVRVLGSAKTQPRYGAVPFLLLNHDGREIPSMAVAACLSYFHGIQVRANHHCTPVLLQELKGISTENANRLTELALQHLGKPYQSTSSDLTAHLADPCDPLSALHAVRASVSYSTCIDDMDALAHALQTIQAEKQHENLTVRCNPFLGVSEYLPKTGSGTSIEKLLQPKTKFEDIMLNYHD